MIARQVSYLALVIILLMTQYTDAQEIASASFVADKTTPLIGEPVHLTLVIVVPHQSFVEMPQLGENWPPFMVREISSLATSTQDGKDIYQQVITVLLWQPGDYSTPQTKINYQMPSSQLISQLEVEPAFFTVPSTLNDTDKALRPLKPPVAMPFIPPWIVVIVCLSVAGIFVWVVRFLKLYRYKNMQKPKQVGGLHDAALGALTELKRIVGQSGNPITIYSQTVDCLRSYLQRRFEVDASDMTTTEIVTALREQQTAPRKEWDELQRLLERADLVKFARVEPQLESAKQFTVVTSQWIGRLERTIDQKNL